MIAEAELKKGAPARNLVALFEAQAKARAEGTAVKLKRDGRWQDVSWAELARRARDVSDGLAAIGLRPGDRVAIIGETNLEWILADLGILGAAGITVTIYQSNKAAECQYILADSGARFVFCDTDRPGREDPRRARQAPGARGHRPRDRHGGGRRSSARSRTSSAWARSGGTRTPTRTRSGSRPSARTCPRASSTPPARPATRRASSSPTANWVYEGNAVEQLRIIGPDDRPPHVPADGPLVREGHRGGLVRHRRDGRVRRVAGEDPRQRLRGEADGDAVGAAHLREGLQHRRLEGARDAGPQGQAVPARDGELRRSTPPRREQGKSYSSFGFTIGKKLVFPKLTHALNERFGGRMRLFVSGGAPLSPKIAHFFDVLGFTILEGYGLTESSAGTFVNRPGKNRIGTVGPPVPGTEVRIAEDGEILIKGGGVMKGYYNDPAATARC